MVYPGVSFVGFADNVSLLLPGNIVRRSHTLSQRRRGSGLIGPNCPEISGTVTDFIGLSRIPESFIIVPEVEERRAIKPQVAQMLASLGVYGGIMRLAARPKRFVVSSLRDNNRK